MPPLYFENRAKAWQDAMLNKLFPVRSGNPIQYGKGPLTFTLDAVQLQLPLRANDSLREKSGQGTRLEQEQLAHGVSPCVQTDKMPIIAEGKN